MDKPNILNVCAEYGIKIHRNKGICPLHKEKSASFTITPESGLFYCFGCGAGGDSIRLIALLTNQSDYDVIKSLKLNKVTKQTIVTKTKNDQIKKFENWVTQTYLTLADYYRILGLWLEVHAVGTPLWLEAINNRDMISYWLDCLEDNPKAFYETNKRAVKAIAVRLQRIT